MENSDHILTNKELRKGFFGLYFGRVVMAVASGLLGIFLPIFLYNILDGNIPLVMAYYASSCIAYLFLVAFGAQFLNRFGFRKALVLASISAATINIAYFFTTKENMLVLLPVSLVFLVIFRLLFWIPYHVDFAIFTNKGKRGGQVGLLLSTITFLGVVGPMIAGYFIETWSMQVLFFIAIITYALGMIPLHPYREPMNDLAGAMRAHGGNFLQKRTGAWCGHLSPRERRIQSASSSGLFLFSFFSTATISKSAHSQASSSVSL